jgi:hypothetical protein
VVSFLLVFLPILINKIKIRELRFISMSADSTDLFFVY